MPLYDYKCPSCGLVEERKRQMDELNSEICYDCFNRLGEFIAMNRIYVPIGTIFKGNGFYRTDNRKKMPD